jgi:hypothetical protein
MLCNVHFGKFGFSGLARPRVPAADRENRRSKERTPDSGDLAATGLDGGVGTGIVGQWSSGQRPGLHGQGPHHCQPFLHRGRGAQIVRWLRAESVHSNGPGPTRRCASRLIRVGAARHRSDYTAGAAPILLEDQRRHPGCGHPRRPTMLRWRDSRLEEYHGNMVPCVDSLIRRRSLGQTVPPVSTARATSSCAEGAAVRPESLTPGAARVGNYKAVLQREGPRAGLPLRRRHRRPHRTKDTCRRPGPPWSVTREDSTSSTSSASRSPKRSPRCGHFPPTRWSST